MLFFLLSGFVIYYSTVHHHDQSFRGYFLRRFKRIYPVYILALVAAFLTASVGSGKSFASSGADIKTLAGNLFMLQDFSTGKPGVWVNTFCGNMALWSLSYEWWFYMMFFPIYRFVPGAYQLFMVAIISLVGFVTYTLLPNQISLFLFYFILWWTGVELAKNTSDNRSSIQRIPTFSTQKISLAILGLFCVLVAWPVFLAHRHGESLNFGIHPVLELRHFTACFVAVIIGLIWARMNWIGFERLLRPFLILAPISYGLYVLHMPLAVNATFLEGHLPRGIELTVYVAIAFFIAWWAEIPYQRMFNRLFSKIKIR